MKKLLTIIFAAIVLLTLNSCDSYAQVGLYDDAVVYEYSYSGHPVRYIHGIAYYYTIYNDVWSWILLPHAYYPYVRHHAPVRYIRPSYKYYPSHMYSHPQHREVRPGQRVNPGNRPGGAPRGGYRPSGGHSAPRGGYNHQGHQGGQRGGGRR